jgi:hypothetical protein
MTKVAHFVGLIFPRGRICIEFDKKTGWATCWALFSQTHLVALAATDFGLNVAIGQASRKQFSTISFLFQSNASIFFHVGVS